jgi:sugar/nucleoside kinase (ribokinase family)
LTLRNRRTVARVGAARRVIVVGDVMTDIIVRQREPFAPSSDTPATITVVPGGSATNQAVWLARAGAEVHLVGVVGDDVFGNASARALRAEGVTAHLARVPDRQSGIVVSVVDATGQRSMLTDRGANLALSVSHVPETLLRGGDHLHLSGYELLDEETRDAAIEILRRGAQSGMTRSVDPCSAGPLARVGATAFLSWTGGLDLCCANLDEGRVLTGAQDPEGIARRLGAHFGEVALTLGPMGALWAKAGAPPLLLPALPGNVIDTTGAGDAFTGTFLAAWLRNAPPAAALVAGLAAAAATIATPGARPAR